MFKFRTKKILLTMNLDNDYQREWYEFLMSLEDAASKGHSKKKFVLSALEHERERLKAEGIGDIETLRRYCKGIKIGNSGIIYRWQP